MSGIVGICRRNGAPVERALLQSLVDFLAFRGPDSRTVWSDGAMGLGHAMLRTTHESLRERQPANLHERFWIAADARLDGRPELATEIARAGHGIPPGAPDSELILRAFARWGTHCVDHLSGDFSFAVWDAHTKQLFCARDHFGIKPFYYAQVGDLFLFSNTLNCLRLHPEVSGEINETAIGDFLLSGLNCDSATTTFRDIRRLPPAHCLIFSAQGLQIRRYWTPPTDGRIRYAKADEYVEHFQALLQAAVADRVRTHRVGILLSGGLDSSSVAAVAKEESAKRAPDTEIQGYTHVYKSLIPDREGDYARETGEFLGIPVKYLTMDEVQLFQGWNDPELSWPEPVDNPLFAGFLDCSRIISRDCRVLLSGEGNDNLMDFQMWPNVKDLRGRGEWWRLLTELANYCWVRPFPWRGIRASVLGLIGKEPDQPVFPQWLDKDFARRLNLEERWKETRGLPMAPATHPIHPRGYASLSLPHWTHMFEQENPGVTLYPVEVRYPFLDLRIVNYLLGVPPFPWTFEKMLLREAMAGRLPERVRVRPKTPLQGDPLSAQFQRTGTAQLDQMPWSPYSSRYIDRSALPKLHGKMDSQQMSVNLRPYCLNIWLQSARRVRYKLHAEAGNG